MLYVCVFPWNGMAQLFSRKWHLKRNPLNFCFQWLWWLLHVDHATMQPCSFFVSIRITYATEIFPQINSSIIRHDHNKNSTFVRRFRFHRFSSMSRNFVRFFTNWLRLEWLASFKRCLCFFFSCSFFYSEETAKVRVDKMDGSMHF